MARRMLLLTGVWLTIAVLSVWVTASNALEPAAVGQTGLAPQQVYGDACPSTCPPLEECTWTRMVGYRYQECCIWDWGCWLNPGEPNYQMKPCRRIVWDCGWLPSPRPPLPPDGIGKQERAVATGRRLVPQLPPVIRCCAEASNCREVNGNPCCEPLNNVLCP